MKKAFVLFESMNHMNIVLKEAKRRGFQIVVLNHDPVEATGPYGVAPDLIDESIYVHAWEDAADVNCLLADLAQRYQVAGTYAGFEPTLVYEAALRELVGLPNNSEATTRFVLDKGSVRKRLYENGLSGLRSVLLSETAAWTEWPFKGSAVLKPINGTGSALCFVVSSLAQLRDAQREAGKVTVNNPLMRDWIAASGEFVLEEKAEGELLSAESLVFDGHMHCMGLFARYVLAADPVVELGGYFPYQHPRHAEIIEKVAAIHACLGLRYGPTHVEVMVPKTGPIELIDFNIRFTGSDSLICLSEALNIPFEKCLTDLACGTMPDLAFLDARPQCAAQVVVLPPPGAMVLRSLEFPPEAIRPRRTKQIDKVLSGRADQLDHIGMFVVKGDTEAELHNMALAARRRVVFNGEPLGDNGNNIVSFSEFMGRPK
ncbi:hypothetical protein AAKU55_005368 [Oxalobacteraceae bacterium GrIS 1.11]